MFSFCHRLNFVHLIVLESIIKKNQVSHDIPIAFIVWLSQIYQKQKKIDYIFLGVSQNFLVANIHARFTYYTWIKIFAFIRILSLSLSSLLSLSLSLSLSSDKKGLSPRKIFACNALN